MSYRTGFSTENSNCPRREGHVDSGSVTRSVEANRATEIAHLPC